MSKANKENLEKLISSESPDTVKRNKERIRNRAMLRESRAIALKILNRLDDLGWSKKRFADEMGMKPQQITKIVSGKENLTLKTLLSIENALNIPLLASRYEKSFETLIDAILPVFKKTEPYELRSDSLKEEDIEIETKETKLSYEQDVSVYDVADTFNLSA